jgi:hypothetical protein
MQALCKSRFQYSQLHFESVFTRIGPACPHARESMNPTSTKFADYLLDVVHFATGWPVFNGDRLICESQTEEEGTLRPHLLRQRNMMTRLFNWISYCPGIWSQSAAAIYASQGTFAREDTTASHSSFVHVIRIDCTPC